MLRSVETHRVRLGTIVKNRRQALQLTQREAADAAGFSDMTWFKVERGDVVSERTLIGVDKAMRWERGSSKGVLAGGEPVPTETAAVASVEDRLTRLEAELRELRAQVQAERDGESKPA